MRRTGGPPGERLEPTLDAIVGDPIFQAILAADRVNPADFTALIERVARRLAGGPRTKVNLSA